MRSLGLFLLIPLSAAALYGVLELGMSLPDPAQSIHVSQADLYEGAFASADVLSGTPRPVVLPHSWREEPAAGILRDEYWYRMKVPLQVPPNRLWGVLLPGIEQNAEIYLNGAVAGGHGQMGKYPSRYINQGLYFTLPNGLLKPGLNTLDIRVRSYPPGRGYLGPVVLGPEEVLRPFYQRRVLIKSDLLWFFVAGSGGMALVILTLAWQRPEETVYRWFAAQTIFWTMATALSLVVDPILASQWMIALSAVCSTWFCATSFLFALRFVAVRHNFLETTVLIAAATGTLVVLSTAAIAPEIVHRIAPLSTIVQMVLGPFVVAIVLQTYWRTRDPELFLILYAAGILIIFGFFSIGEATGLRAGVEGRYLFYATPLFLGAFVILLLRRFVSAMRESEDLTRTLEQRVATKSREIEASYQLIGELEEKQTLARERERIMRDMHDGVGGHLVSSLMRVKALDTDGKAIEATLQSALTDLRLMIDSLEISEGDLNVVLGMLRRRLQAQLEDTGIAIHWQVDALPLVPGLTSHGVLQIMRIIQEVIANTLKHAQATSITLSAKAADGRVIIEVTDDGRGFVVDKRPDGHGLANMRHRAADIGAELSVCAESTGTEVVLSLAC